MFICRGCGDCCRWPGYVYLKDDDVARLAEFLQLDLSDFIEKHTQLAPNRHQLCLRMGAGDACIFLRESKCDVYVARPQQCRDYPRKWRPDEKCPGR